MQERRMTKLRRGSLALVLIASWAAAGSAPVAPKDPRSSAEEGIARARTYWKALDTIGFRGVGLVAKDGKALLLEGSGGVSPTATFDIASIAKSLTAMAVLRLAGRGVLKLDDPLGRFFPDAPPDKRAITVHQLLTHTGGIGNPTGDTATGVKDRATAVRKILAS